MRRILLSLSFLLAIALPCQAQGKPNTLTPKEIADGWILLFDGETTFGWATKGKVRVADGRQLLFDNNAVIEHNVRWGSHELQFQSKAESPMSGGGAFWLKETGIAFGIGSTDTEWHTSKTVFARNAKQPSYDFSAWSGARKTIELTNNMVDLFVQPSFGGPRDGGTDLQIRNIKLRPLKTKSLFNGKDLTGWKEFPGKKSTFAVIDGAINVKDGPGDLQTVGKNKDFILQLECKSNGKHLNSGVFFRCKDNEYQNGYEAQIFNKFTAEPTQDYIVEEYHAKTNKLIEQKKVKSAAVDFGTGAIYRRTPARKEMSKDGEWFAMTIIAHGNHIATWVNGVQVTDWYDHRPKNDNPRLGCRLEAGHISIQGHDPTTDLSFRNLRIAELK